MPTAGFCSQCGRYTWVQPDGRCALGHASDSVRDVHSTDTLPGYSDEPDVPPATSAEGGWYGDTGTAPGASVDLPRHADAPSDVPPGYPPPPPPELWPPSAQDAPQPAEPTLADALPEGVPRFNWGAALIPFVWSLVYGIPEFALLWVAPHGAAIYFALMAHDNTAAVFLEGLALGVAIALGFLGPRIWWKRHPHKLTVAEYNRRQLKWLIAGVAILIAGLFVPRP